MPGKKLNLQEQSQIKFWRCMRCCNHLPSGGYEFYASTRQCPNCGSAGKANVARLEMVHLIFPSSDGPIAGRDNLRWCYACDPKRPVMSFTTDGRNFPTTIEDITKRNLMSVKVWPTTDLASAVTCFCCRNTRIFLATCEEQGFEPGVGRGGLFIPGIAGSGDTSELILPGPRTGYAVKEKQIVDRPHDPPEEEETSSSPLLDPITEESGE